MKPTRELNGSMKQLIQKYIFELATILVVSLCIILIAVAKLRFSQFQLSLSNKGGLVAEQEEKHLKVRAGEKHAEATFLLSNHSEQTISIVGADTNCVCTVIGNKFPMKLEANSRRSVSVAIELNSNDIKLSQNILLYTDSSECPEVKLKVTGEIVK